MSTRVFVARLAGLAVFDPSGDQVGRVRDAVATLRPPGEATKVIGLVVEVQPRRRIFVPMARIISLNRGHIVTTGVVNLRRFERRADETAVIAELLDRKVTLSSSGEDVTVIDIAMEQVRNRDWIVAKVHVRKGGGARVPVPGLRRRGESVTVPWDAITGLTSGQINQGAANMLATFDKLRAADLAHVLHELSPKRRGEVAAELNDDRLADVLEEMAEAEQVEILSELAVDRAADVLEAMQPDDAADLIRELPTQQAEQLLRLMEPGEAAPVRRLLSYADDTAGGLMTTEAVILAPTATVAEALAAIRHPELTPAMAALAYVCRAPLDTPTGKFLGVAHFQRLLREPPSASISAAMDRELKALRPDTPLADVTSYLATYNMVAAPVVDTGGRLVGVVSVDDVLDHLLPANWRGREALAEDDDEEAPARFDPEATAEIQVYNPRTGRG
ncbi:MAG: magnesium transporter MgtE N-terminal domain-containing protein [Sporichthyaceae bacterium]